MQLEPERQAQHATRKHRIHPWKRSTRHVSTSRAPTTAFDRACQKLCGVYDTSAAIAALLEGRAKRVTVKAWRYGKRNAPAWAIAVLVQHLRHKGEEMLAAAAELEKEKGAR